MPNLLITGYCNRSCPYCFARGKIRKNGSGRRTAKKEISLENAAYVVDFLKRSGHEVYSLLGGEPTLHPRFREIADHALSRGMTVRIFSNGLMDASVCRYIFRNNLAVILNINEPGDTPPAQRQQLETVFENLGPNIWPGFNIYREDFDLSFLFRMIDRFRFNRAVRIGLAQPVHGGDNEFLSPEKYRSVGKRLAAFAAEADRNDIRLNFDCGFVPCMFRTAEMGRLVAAHADLKFSCGPTIDIDPDLNTWSCFPLSSIQNRRLTDFSTLGEVMDHYGRFLGSYASSGIFPRCGRCRFLHRRQCPGGCVSHKLASAGAGLRSGKAAGGACR